MAVENPRNKAQPHGTVVGGCWRMRLPLECIPEPGLMASPSRSVPARSARSVAETPRTLGKGIPASSGLSPACHKTRGRSQASLSRRADFVWRDGRAGWISTAGRLIVRRALECTESTAMSGPSPTRSCIVGGRTNWICSFNRLDSAQRRGAGACRNPLQVSSGIRAVRW